MAEFRVLTALAVLAVIHGVGEMRVVPFWVLTTSISLSLLYAGSWYSLLQRRRGGDKVENPMSQGDALQFPVIASAVLVGIAFLYRYLPAEIVNMILRVYFAAVTVFVIGGLVSWCTDAILRSVGASSSGPLQRPIASMPLIGALARRAISCRTPVAVV